MISVIVPTLNEAETIGSLLHVLRAEPEVHEVLVVDGGSRDGTREIARACGVPVFETEAGRGQQLARGAAAAGGDILLFLHADTRFPSGGLGAIERELAARPDCSGGNFRLLFDGNSGFDRWLTGFYGWFRRFGLYYGDSGIFVRRAAYDRLGGFRPLVVMEDYDFSRRLERLGPTCCIDEPPLVTSSRRFRGRSTAAIIHGWLRMHCLYHLGASPEYLAQLYDAAAPPLGMRRHGAGDAR